MRAPRGGSTLARTGEAGDVPAELRDLGVPLYLDVTIAPEASWRSRSRAARQRHLLRLPAPDLRTTLSRSTARRGGTWCGRHTLTYSWPLQEQGVSNEALIRRSPRTGPGRASRRWASIASGATALAHNTTSVSPLKGRRSIGTCAVDRPAWVRRHQDSAFKRQARGSAPGQSRAAGVCPARTGRLPRLGCSRTDSVAAKHARG